jgi:D-sedoheptulose 7-phosphate isomerase
MIGTGQIAGFVQDRLLSRNEISRALFAREAPRLADACRGMSERFLRGGRLLAFGQGASATDAQHVSVEFVHPIIVGKRALPALDLSLMFRPWLGAIVEPDDIVMGFGPPERDADVAAALDFAHARGAMTFALPGNAGNAGNAGDAGARDYAVDIETKHPFIHQEMLEILYHTLWETVHVFFEHRELGLEVGEAGFLYPFLGTDAQDTSGLVSDVAESIAAKAREDERLREDVAARETDQIAALLPAVHERVSRGGKLLMFGNGGSATDANDLAFDCVSPPAGYAPIPAISLAMEPATVTAIANDVGTEVIFLRQLIAHARAGDVAVAISTSGGSRNIILALEEARKRGLLTVALLGYDGGEIRRQGLADFPVVVRCDYIPRIQEVQATIYHVIRESLEQMRHG